MKTKKPEKPKVVRDREHGGYRIKYPDGSKSIEGYPYKVGAQYSIDHSDPFGYDEYGRL